MLRNRKVWGVLGVLLALVVVVGYGQVGGNPFARPNIVKMLQNQFAPFALKAEDRLDFDSAVLWSDGGPRLIGYVPPHPESAFLSQVQQLLGYPGKKEPIWLGGLYVGEDRTGRLPPGAYIMRLVGERAVLYNAAGKEVAALKARVDRTRTLPEKLERIPFELTIITPAEPMAPRCFVTRIGNGLIVIEYGLH